jgi:hypothetical protein
MVTVGDEIKELAIERYRLRTKLQILIDTQVKPLKDAIKAVDMRIDDAAGESDQGTLFDHDHGDDIVGD